MGGHGLRILLLISFVFLTSSFNLNSNYSRALHKQTKAKSFGYSISFHQENGKTWLLVGAPLSDTAYKCGLAGDITCSKLNIPAAKDSWLGATVVSGNGSALVCAPRRGSYLEGECYYAAGGSSTFMSLNSLIVNAIGKGYCNFGFSASISAEQILIGGPSCRDNSGNMFQISRTHLTSLNRISSSSSNYFSYATTTGRTNNNNEGLVTSTVFRSTTGEVHLVDISSGTITRTIKGQQQGEFYGNSLAAADVDGNGLEDLLVGAPHYTDYDDPSIKYEAGRVYIYHQGQQNGAFSFDSTPTRILVGRAGGGRFGHAIASLGDVNGDGFNDVAISAPYEDHGNVYIYFGSASGLRSEPGQVISGSRFSLRAFGFSLTGNADVDNNGYADLAVGAYQSDAIVYLPASPVIRMTTLSLIFQPTQISLEEKLCHKNDQPVSCSRMTSCLSYTDPLLPSSIEFKVSIVLDFRQSKDARLLFRDTSNMSNSFTATVTRGKSQCSEHQVYIRPNTTDKLSPMDTQMAIQVIGHQPFNAELPPVLDAYTQNSITSSITIANNCGPDNICIPDLDLKITTNNTVLIEGDKQYPEVQITIRNKGESAFEASFNMRLPDTLLFRESKGVPCSTPGVENEPSVKCDIGNPLESGFEVKFTVSLEPRLNIMSQSDSISFSCEATSKNQEISTTLHDNKATLELQLAANTSLTLNSRPVELLFNRTFYELSGKNETALPQFSQEYVIFNNGPSTILGANVTIHFAVQLRGVNITNLENLQVSEDQGTCQRNDEEMEGFIVISCQIQRLAGAEGARSEERGGARRVVLSLGGQLTEAVYDENENDTMAVRSEFTAVVTRLPFGLDPSQVKVAKGEATLRITRSKSAPVEYKLEWWYYLASALGAVLLLAAISAVLYKLGFFTRNRPPTSPNDTTELHDKKAEETEEEAT